MMATSKPKTPTLKQLMKLHAKAERLRSQKWHADQELIDMARKIRGKNELVVDGDKLYRVSVGWGHHPSVSVDLIGSKDSISQMIS